MEFAAGVMILLDGKRWSWKIRYADSEARAKILMLSMATESFSSRYYPAKKDVGVVTMDLFSGRAEAVENALAAAKKHQGAPRQLDPARWGGTHGSVCFRSYRFPRGEKLLGTPVLLRSVDFYNPKGI